MPAAARPATQVRAWPESSSAEAAHRQWLGGQSVSQSCCMANASRERDDGGGGGGAFMCNSRPRLPCSRPPPPCDVCSHHPPTSLVQYPPTGCFAGGQGSAVAKPGSAAAAAPPAAATVAEGPTGHGSGGCASGGDAGAGGSCLVPPADPAAVPLPLPLELEGETHLQRMLLEAISNGSVHSSRSVELLVRWAGRCALMCVGWGVVRCGGVWCGGLGCGAGNGRPHWLRIGPEEEFAAVLLAAVCASAQQGPLYCLHTAVFYHVRSGPPSLPLPALLPPTGAPCWRSRCRWMCSCAPPVRRLAR